MKKMFILLSLLLFACSDQNESNYRTFKIAKENNFFQNGWIPNELIFESMTNIYLRNNLDTNSAIFYFVISDTDLQKLESRLYKDNFLTIEIKSLNIPQWWKSKVEQLSRYTLSTENNVGISINRNTNEIFGWRSDDH